MTEPTPSTSAGNYESQSRFDRNRKNNAIADYALSGTMSNSQKQRLNDLSEKVEKYTNFNCGIRFEKSPNFINGELRKYQIDALNWLISLHENEIGGILADEMGLGKTLEAISILGFLKFFKNINGPFLVIGTKSVISSWKSEFKKFCPAIRVAVLVDSKQMRSEIIPLMQKQQIKWDVCVTTFEIVTKEIQFFHQQKWHYIVVDEAHKLKNENTVFGKFIRKLPSRYRLLLTGTALQNNLHELWALLNYLMPEIFSSSDDFDTWFDPKGCDQGSIKCLKEILKPFFLRRIKADVETSLLPKLEYTLFIGLTKLQRDTYLKAAESKFIAKTTVQQNLLKIANHPYLIHGVEPGPPYVTHGNHLVNTSGKMMVLDKLLNKLKSEGSRVLLFSQFSNMLDIIEDYLDWRRFEFRRLDGQTQYLKRANDIDEFNTENSKVFIYIISTKAGSLGINLQGADVVIIFDSDYNPQTDLQAIDRAHRIGQKKQVRVFRLVTEITIDELIVQRAMLKSFLNDMMIENGRTFENCKITNRVKDKAVHFGIEAIRASNTAGINDINLNALIAQSQKKTKEAIEKLKKVNEQQLMLSLDKPSASYVNHALRISNGSIQSLERNNQNQIQNQNLSTNTRPLISQFNQQVEKSNLIGHQENRQNQGMIPSVTQERNQTQSLLSNNALSIIPINKETGSNLAQMVRPTEKGVTVDPIDYRMPAKDIHQTAQPSNQNQILQPNKKSSHTPVNHNAHNDKMQVSEQNKQTTPAIIPINQNQLLANGSSQVNPQNSKNQILLQTNKNQITPVIDKQQHGLRAVPVVEGDQQSRNDNCTPLQPSNQNRILLPNMKPPIITNNQNENQQLNEKPSSTVDNIAGLIQRNNHNRSSVLSIEPSASAINQNKQPGPQNNTLQQLPNNTSSITPVNHNQISINNNAQVIQESNQKQVLHDAENVNTDNRIHLNFYQFYPTELIALCDDSRTLNMSTATEVKKELLQKGFHQWTYDDYKIFCNAVQKFGRFDLSSVGEMMPSKEMKEVVKYHEVFFRRGPIESAEILNIVKKIILEEVKNLERADALRWKMMHFGKPEFELTLNSQKPHSKFTRDHDQYLICAASRYGFTFNMCSRIISDIRFHSDFGLFSTFRFGTISDREIEDRINDLMSFIHKEYLQTRNDNQRSSDDRAINNAKRQKLN